MRKTRTWTAVLRLSVCLVFAAPLAASSDDDEGGTQEGSLRRSDRMEFDARLVRGQKATSGAVYLFQRAPRALPPLVVLEQSYLDRIVDPVLGTEESEGAGAE